MPVKVNKQKLEDLKLKVSVLSEELVEGAVRSAAAYIVRTSPVITGAYVKSHTVLPRSSTGGRSISSQGLPRAQSPDAKKNEAFAQVASDIGKIGDSIVKGAVIRNRAPHAMDVENKHKVYRNAAMWLKSRGLT